MFLQNCPQFEAVDSVSRVRREECDTADYVGYNKLGIVTKERSRPWVSNVTSADVRLATALGRATSLVNVTKSV